jgi:hypothetical protein
MKNINLVKKQIDQFCSLMKQSLDRIDQETIQRHRKLETTHILYCLCLKVCYQMGYQDVVSKMEGDGFLNNISYQSINNKILSGKYIKPFTDMNQHLLRTLFPTKNTNKRVAVDGSHIQLPISLRRNGYMRIRTDPYVTGLISTIYDLENHVPISYDLEKSLNERSVFYEQFSKMDQSMIVIGDRGYFSNDVMLKILGLKRNFIFRLPINSYLVNQINEAHTREIITHLNGFKIRIIHYQLPSKKRRAIIPDDHSKIKFVPINNDYYFVTSLTDVVNYPTDQIIEWYHHRWEIEEYYKTIKKRLVTGTVMSTSETGTLNEIAIQHMLSILVSFFSNLLTTNVHQKANHKILLNRIVDHILPSIFFDKPYTKFFKNIIDHLESIEQYQIPIRNGRSFPREQRFHSKKFPTRKIQIDQQK